MEIALHRRPGAGHRDAQQQKHDPDTYGDPVARVERPRDGDRDDDKSRQHAGCANRPSGHPFRDDPPGAGHGDRQTHETDEYVAAVPEQRPDDEPHERRRADQCSERSQPAAL